MGEIPGVALVVPEGGHDDERRTIRVIVNDGPGEFRPGQVKLLLVKQDAWLGGQKGHFHSYTEMYAVIGGKAVFYLQSIDHPELKETAEVTGELRLTIPPRVAHKVWVQAGTILLGLTKEPYFSPSQDSPFEVEVGDASPMG